MNMAPTATKEGEMTKEEEAKALKTEKRKKVEASKKEKEEPSAKIAKKEEKPEPVSIYQTILAMERKESEVESDPKC